MIETSQSIMQVFVVEWVGWVDGRTVVMMMMKVNYDGYDMSMMMRVDKI